MEYDPDDLLSQINKETKARWERERIESEERHGRYQTFEQWKSLWSDFKQATKAYCENRALGDTEENQRSFASAILKTANEVVSLVGVESLSRTCDYVAEVIEYDGPNGNGIGSESRRDEYRLGRLLLESANENSEQSTFELLRLNSTYDLPMSFSIDDLQFDIWHIDQLVDWMKHWQPKNLHQIRTAIERLRELARLAKHAPKRIQNEVERFLRPDGETLCIFTQWFNWFQKYKKGSQLAADLRSLVGRLGSIATGRETDPQKNHDDLNFWAMQLERPLIEFADPMRRKELRAFFQEIDRTFGKTNPNSIRRFFYFAICVRDWFETAAKIDKETNSIGEFDGWVQSLFRHLQPADGYSQIQQAFQQALSDANNQNSTTVLIPKLELVFKLHEQLADAYHFEKPELQSVRQKHNDALNDLLNFVEAIEPPNSTVADDSQATETGQNERDALLRLLNVFSNNIADERLKQAAAVVANESLSAIERLEQIDKLIRIPSNASASQLGKLLGVTRQHVAASSWWGKNRKGAKEVEIEGRRSMQGERSKHLTTDKETDD